VGGKFSFVDRKEHLLVAFVKENSLSLLS
jgi:hypothetical protein